ncbi:head GIN domain-containing protein [Archangium sp.]|uniref:head GIN domain-containing protein n=1 Tax=Archangium sp. TaxID=1872627 RepID=UPI002D714D7B|nr:head GIN domain-containing protein [Archangium sp.]HYO56359.1 head GIN domain-containing protein [Archangium sp.]
MQLRSLLLPVVLLVSVPAFAQDAAAKAGQIEVPDFRGVAVSHGIHAEVKPGPKSVRLEGSKDDLARVKLEVKDGVLTTQVERTSTFFNKGLKDVRLYVTNPRVESVAASGGAQVDAEATRVDTFEMAASGGAVLEISGVDSQKLEVAASGGSVLKLEGRAGELKVTGSGGSIIQAGKVRAESLHVTASGGTRVEATPERSIQGTLSGGSTVKSSKKPASVQVNSSGGSQVQYE